MSTTLKLGMVASAILFALALFASTTLADTSCTISGNGPRSRNRCRIRITRSRRLRQSNWSSIRNSVKVVSNTGGNDANSNTGGDVDVTSGDSTVVVIITNTVNQNNVAP